MRAIFLQQATLFEPRPQPRLDLASGAGAALRLLARLDYRLFVIHGSNHAAQHRLEDLLFRETLTLDGCCCGAPLAEMLRAAARAHGVALASAWMVGDTLGDVEAGNRAGCKTLLIDNGSEHEWRLGADRIPLRIAADVYDAAQQIINCSPDD